MDIDSDSDIDVTVCINWEPSKGGTPGSFQGV